MSYQWAHRFEDGQVRMACSKCGVPYRFPDELEKLADGYFYCLRTCKEQTVLARDKKIAQSRRRREMPPPKFTLPVRYQEDYLGAEGQIFSFVSNAIGALCRQDLRTSGHAIQASPPLAGDSAWAANYFADLINENERPTAWINRSRTLLKASCDFLLRLQYGSPVGPSPGTASTATVYGGLVIAVGLTLMNTDDCAAAGAAFVKGYQILGDATYLAGADRCAQFLRHMQCGNLDTSARQTTYPAAGSAYYVGGFAAACSTVGSQMITNFSPYISATGIWFLNLLSGLRGPTTTYGETIPSGAFSGSTLATLATMIADATTFMASGAKDSLNSGSLICGLSATTPRELYEAGTAANGGSASWLMVDGAPPSGVQINGDNLAQALWGLYQVYGINAQVTAVYNWLMTGVSNTANQAPSEDASKLAATTAGTWSPLNAPAIRMDALSAGVAIAPKDHTTTGSLYSWAAGGLLAPIHSARNATAFQAAKDQLSVPQIQSDGQGPEWIGPLAASGLAFQPWTDAAHTIRSRDIIPACKASMFYRYGVRAFGDMYSNPVPR